MPRPVSCFVPAMPRHSKPRLKTCSRDAISGRRSGLGHVALSRSSAPGPRVSRAIRMSMAVRSAADIVSCRRKPEASPCAAFTASTTSLAATSSRRCCQRWGISRGTAVPTMKACTSTLNAASRCAACRSSILPEAISRCRTSRKRSGWCATARSTTSANCVPGYLHLGYVAAPHCIFKGMRKLPPATLLSVEAGQVREWRYWRLPQKIDNAVSESQWTERVREQIAESVRMQMVSDVPIGAFLSGGVDSSAVVGSMARHSIQPIRTYAIGFEGGEAEALYNELPYARRVAELFGTQHREIVVRPDVVSLLPKLL